MSIVTATWADLGYRKLGPNHRLDANTTKLLAGILHEYEFHDVQSAGDERWVRDKARRQDFATPWLIRRVASITRDTTSNSASYKFIERAAQQKYAKTQRRLTATWDQLVSMTRADQGEARWRRLYSLSTAATLADPESLATLLRQHVLPSFFDLYPDGRVVFYESNYEFERRYGLSRAMYALSQYDLSDLNRSDGFRTLRQWQSIDTLTQPRTLFGLLGAALYPQVYIVDTWAIGLRLLFILDPPERHEPPPFPSSWLSFPQSRWDFGDQMRDHIAVLAGTDPMAHERAVHGRFRIRDSFAASDVENYIDWFAERYSRLAFHLSDPCEFVRDDCVDPVTAFEFALTVDRILRKAISCVASEENAVRKAASQEIADLLETLRAFSDPGAGNAVFFKQLHHANDGFALVQKCLAQVPTPFRNLFEDSAKQVYDELLAAVRSSVWVKTKLTPNGVFVKPAFRAVA